MARDTTTEVASMDNVTKALALARLGIKVFPVHASNRAPAIPEKEGGRGFYDAVSDDFEKIATWFSMDYVGDKYAVGVWAGGSGLVTADIDRKNGKDGFARLAENDRELSFTENYPTQSGGEHHIYESERLDLTLGRDVLGMEGVDIRAGGSYFVWWGDTVPESRDAFSTDIPDWVIEAAHAESTFTGEGFSGDVKAWFEHIDDDPLPSGRIRELLARIPAGDFGHPEMTDLVWSAVRMGSERETGVQMALAKIRSEWLRGKYDTAANRRDFDKALLGAIRKGGRVQNPLPSIGPLVGSMKKAVEAGVDGALKALERKVSETDSEIELARARREMFKIAASAGLSPSAAIGIVAGSKSFKNSKAPIESVWYGDGEPEFHTDTPTDETEEETEEQKATREAELAKLMTRLSRDAEAYTFLSAPEKALVDGYKWFGSEYLGWVKTRLKHFNTPYHVASLWAALSVITSPWGKVPLAGAEPTDCNLYINVLGESSTGKSEAWRFAVALIDAFYGTDHSPIIGDISKLSALALHRALILRDGEPSLVYGDEVQSFFQGVQNTQWQNGILGDVSSHYGGNVAPKLTLNDKEISGKRAKTLFTTFLTGIADQTLDAVNINHWTNGFFFRYLWGFGYPRTSGDYEIKMESSPTSYTTQMEDWAREFKRVGAVQEVKWGPGRLVKWEADAVKRMEQLKEQIDVATRSNPLYDSVFVNANTRFIISVMKAATIVAMTEAAEKVTLDHALVAISFAGPWHRAMVLAVSETGRDSFDRDCEKALIWIKRNAIRQVGKPAWIQRSAVMRAFKPNEVADRLLRQLTEEGWLVRSGDKYELTELTKDVEE